MAYARFSTNLYTSDVYVYASAHGGYVVEVASNRLMFDRDTIPEITADRITEPESWKEQYDARYEELERRIKGSTRVPVDHYLAGSSHDGLSAEECHDLLNELGETGFTVPDGIAEDILSDGDVEPIEEEPLEDLLNELGFEMTQGQIDQEIERSEKTEEV